MKKVTTECLLTLRKQLVYLNRTGFDQINTRAHLNTKAINDKLDLNFNLSYTKFDRNLGDERAFEFAQFYNPTAPIFAMILMQDSKLVLPNLEDILSS